MAKEKKYPLGTFMKEFGTERKCREYLANLRWPDGFAKNIFGFRKTVYRELRKKLNRLHVLFAGANLYMLARVGGSLRPAWDSCAL